MTNERTLYASQSAAEDTSQRHSQLTSFVDYAITTS